MTAKIINLRQFRKAKARAEKERQAEENRTRHGQTKADRRQHESERALADRNIEALRRDKDPDDRQN